jgi:hypothetical protein
MVTAAAMSAAPGFLHAQATHRLELTLVAGAGRTVSLAQPGVDRSAGPTFVGGIELARPALSGLLGRLSLRLESGFASQDFEVDDGAVSGDVQTVHAALALRVDLWGRAARRLTPYALAGAAWARPSTRFELHIDPQTTPGAGFEQVTHENVPGAIVGAGVAWQTRPAQVRVEARWMTLRTSERVTSSLPVAITLAVPLRR